MAAKAAAEEAARQEQARLEREAVERAAAEEAASKASAASKAAKAERDRQRKEQLRKEGKLLSKSDKERLERNRAKLAQLQAASNLIINTKKDNDGKNELEEHETAAIADGQKKKVVYEKKKKRPTIAKTEETTEIKSIKDLQKVEDVPDDWDASSTSSSTEGEDQAEGEKQAKIAEIKMSQMSLKDEQSHPASMTEEKRKTLRSPICCILGHVDTGKTKLLDRIRETNVQEGEAGGITQQIGATYIPIEAIQGKTHHITALCADLGDKDHPGMLLESSAAEKITDNSASSPLFSVPGLLVIDTPGHESFSNLRSRGSSLCNMAVLVVDIMHGLEPQTIESIGLLRSRKTPFVVALNKIDRLYGWKAHPELPIHQALLKQNQAVQKEFEARLQETIVAFAEQGLNACLFFRNENVRKMLSLVPTSAITGDGVADLLFFVVRLTQRLMVESLAESSNSGDGGEEEEVKATVLEVKVVEGIGPTLDVILSQGRLREGDRVAVAGMQGPILTTIRSLLTPQPLREMRVKAQGAANAMSGYQQHKSVRAARGVRVVAGDLGQALPGSPLLLCRNPKEEAEARDLVQADWAAMLSSVDSSGKGVCVQASTLGSLEALLTFLQESKIPVPHPKKSFLIFPANPGHSFNSFLS